MSRAKSLQTGIPTWAILDFRFWILDWRSRCNLVQSKIQNPKSKIAITVTRSCGTFTRLPCRLKHFRLLKNRRQTADYHGSGLQSQTVACVAACGTAPKKTSFTDLIVLQWISTVS